MLLTALACPAAASSPQQLRSFNAPFQLGRAHDTIAQQQAESAEAEGGSAADQTDDRFETPEDASIVRVPVSPGDVIVLATDGLFDNMPEADVLEIVERHAKRYVQREATRRSSMSDPDGGGAEDDARSGSAEAALARELAERAKELSLDNSLDSPFAILAKDNDILWSGGRPDDITIIVSTVVDASQKPPGFSAVTGPGLPPAELEGVPMPSRTPTEAAPLHEAMEYSWD